MFSLTIAFGDGTSAWKLLFNEKEAAETAWRALSDGKLVVIQDDYGQRASFETAAVKACMFEDMEQSKLAAIQLMLHQARTQAKASEMAQSDPVLRAARFQQGPAVLTPGMNGIGR